jgi:hypothetical protein
MMNKNQVGMIEKKMVDGETIQRRLSPQYEFTAQTLRKGPVDFSVCSALQEYLRPYVEQHELPQLAYQHLVDADNEDLAEDVRTEHFDLAGSMVWQFNSLHGFSFPEMGAFFTVWKEANGV